MSKQINKVKYLGPGNGLFVDFDESMPSGSLANCKDFFPEDPEDELIGALASLLPFVGYILELPGSDPQVLEWFDGVEVRCCGWSQRKGVELISITICKHGLESTSLAMTVSTPPMALKTKDGEWSTVYAKALHSASERVKKAVMAYLEGARVHPPKEDSLFDEQEEEDPLAPEEQELVEESLKDDLDDIGA